MSSALKNDVARCHDASCAVREGCRRWLERESGGPYVVHTWTLRKGYEDQSEPCERAILTTVAEG